MSVGRVVCVGEWAAEGSSDYVLKEAVSERYFLVTWYDVPVSHHRHSLDTGCSAVGPQYILRRVPEELRH